MEYMYIITLNDRKRQNVSKCLLPNGTERKKTSSHIILGPQMHLVCLEQFFVANNGEGWGGGGEEF